MYDKSEQQVEFVTVSYSYISVSLPLILYCSLTAEGVPSVHAHINPDFLFNNKCICRFALRFLLSH